ncbi:hypothetical protein GWI33_017002 [Rhynchophorus ferrugineus]|uniref:Uncharacterized protein n=1 Tax=Rhynchophorus ferrugineus TaxID=354439 RepID=A0A834M4E7_RHYFE|nr:hypothetical protein GWI33_017002 [Rhynchophorus ferrugineus]
MVPKRRHSDLLRPEENDGGGEEEGVRWSKTRRRGQDRHQIREGAEALRRIRMRKGNGLIAKRRVEKREIAFEARRGTCPPPVGAAGVGMNGGDVLLS